MSRAQRRAGAVAVLLAGAVALTGCAANGDPLRDHLADITNAANDRDADALRAAADDLLAELEAQQAAGELTAGEVQRFGDLTRQVRADADLIDQDLLDVEQARREAEEAARRVAEERAAREAAEEAARKAEEAARKAAEEAQKAKDEAEKKDDEKKKDEKKDDEDEDEGDG